MYYFTQVDMISLIIWSVLAGVGFYWWKKYHDRESLWCSRMSLVMFASDALEPLITSQITSQGMQVLYCSARLTLTSVILVLWGLMMSKLFTKNHRHISWVDGWFSIKGIAGISLIVAVGLALFIYI